MHKMSTQLIPTIIGTVRTGLSGWSISLISEFQTIKTPSCNFNNTCYRAGRASPCIHSAEALRDHVVITICVFSDTKCAFLCVFTSQYLNLFSIFFIPRNTEILIWHDLGESKFRFLALFSIMFPVADTRPDFCFLRSYACPTLLRYRISTRRLGRPNYRGVFRPFFSEFISNSQRQRP